MGKRNEAIDVMKGITLLLVMLGHFGFGNHPIDNVFHSFRMPLFFILAGYFTKPTESVSAWLAQLKKSARRLLLPFFCTAMLMILYGAIQSLLKHSSVYVLRMIVSCFYMNDSCCPEWLPNKFIAWVGPMWFLPALFWAKSIMGGIGQLGKGSLPLAIVIAIPFIVFRDHVCWLPWQIQQGFAALPFVAVGWWIKQYGISKLIMGLAVVSWPIAIAFSGIEMSSGYYSCLPLDVFGGLGGTIVMYYFSKTLVDICKKGNVIGLVKPFMLVGVYSLAILCMHNFELVMGITNSIAIHVPFFQSGVLYVLTRFLITFIFAFVVIKMPILKLVYK